MSTEESEKRIEEVVVAPRPWTFVLGLILVAMMVTVETWLNGFTSLFLEPFGVYGYWWNVQLEYWGNFLWPFIGCIILAIINKVKAVTRQEATIVVTMLFVTWMLPLWNGIGSCINSGAAFINSGEPYITWYKEAFGPVRHLYAPDFEDPTWLEGWLRGGAAVPWVKWAPTIVYLTVVTSLYYITMVFLASLFFQSWIQVESLPFPVASGQAMLVDAAVGAGKEETKRRGFLNVYFWIGIVAGIAMSGSWWLSIFVPGFAPKPLAYDFTPLGFLPWAPIVFSVDPFYIGSMLLIPVGILESHILFFLIFYWIIPPAAAWAGIVDKQPATWTWASTWWGWVRTSVGPTSLANWAQWTYGHYNHLVLGFMFGIVAYSFWTTRGIWISSIRGIWKKEASDVEAQQPLPYKYLWGCLAFSGLLYALVMWYASNYELPGWYLLYEVVFPVWIVTALSSARIRGEFGYGGFTNYNVTHTHTVWHYWWWASPSSPMYTEDPASFMRQAQATGQYFWSGYINGPSAATSPTVMTMFKVGDLNNTHPRYILYASLIAIPFAIVLVNVLMVQFNYMYGALNKWSAESIGGMGGHWGMVWNGWASYLKNPWQWVGRPPTIWMHVTQLVGAVAAFILMYVRTRAPWLPVHPIGVVSSTWAPPIVFLPAVIALIAKLIVLRVGGPRLHETTLLPLGVGLSLGTGLMFLIGAIVRAYQLLSA